MIYTLQLADDRVAMAQSKEDLEYMCRKLQEEYSKWGLTMNIAKTNYMSLGIDTNYLDLDNGDVITGCTEYNYLGSIFIKDERHTKNMLVLPYIYIYIYTYIHIYIYIYTGCHRRKGPNFGRVFLMLNYTDITQNTYIQS